MGRPGSENGGKRSANGRFAPGGAGGPGRPRRRSIAERLDGWRQMLGAGIAGRFDGWRNALTGVGDLARDKRLGGAFDSARLSFAEEAELWQGNALAARIVETWPNDMVREGWRMVVRGDESDANDLAEEVEAHHEEIGLVDAIWEALAFERAYGGGAILLGARDFRPLDQPLEIDRVDSFDWVTTFDPSEISPRYWYSNPRAPKFGKPSHYVIYPHAEGPSKEGAPENAPILVHESRLIVFRGHRVSRRRSTNGKVGWGQSTLARVYGVLRDHNMGFDSAAILLNDFAQTVFKINGLAQAIAEDRDEEIKVRAQAVEIARSVARAVIIDSEEEFERKQTPMTGLPETLDRFSSLLAAVADMPLTLLMGVSPGGLNATGESDIRFHYDRVKAAQIKKLTAPLEMCARLSMRSLRLKEPRQWSYTFNPLWQPSEKERSEARYAQAQTDQIYIENMVLTPEDVARSRFGGDGYSYETHVDLEERRRLEEEQRRVERLAQEQSIMSAQAASGKRPEAPKPEPEE